MNQPTTPHDRKPDTQSTPPTTRPKRQHFLPKFYLDGFCVDGKLAVYDRTNGLIRVAQPLNTGVIGHFYTLTDADGNQRFEIEKMLSEWESAASPIIAKLAAKELLTDDERSDLAIFVALAGFRTPEMADSLKQMNSSVVDDCAKFMFSSVKQAKALMQASKGNTISDTQLEIEAQALVNFVQSGNYQITTKHSWAVMTALKLAFKIAPILDSRQWLVLHRQNNKKSFVTTDAPLLLGTDEIRPPSIWGIGFANPDAIITFSLTQSCALVMGGDNRGLQHREIDGELIRKINRGIASGCQRFVIGRDVALIKSVTDSLGLGSTKWQPKMQSMSVK
jgi:hypothetical protein